MARALYLIPYDQQPKGFPVEDYALSLKQNQSHLHVTVWKWFAHERSGRL